MSAWSVAGWETGRPLSSHSSGPQPLKPATLAMSERQALDRALTGRAERQQIEQCPENPQRKIEQRAGQHDRAAAEQLDDRARLCALRVGKARKFGDILRMLGDLKRIERAAHPDARLDPAEVAGDLCEPLARFHLEQPQQRRADM